MKWQVLEVPQRSSFSDGLQECAMMLCGDELGRAEVRELADAFLRHLYARERQARNK